MANILVGVFRRGVGMASSSTLAALSEDSSSEGGPPPPPPPPPLLLPLLPPPDDDDDDVGQYDEGKDGPPDADADADAVPRGGRTRLAGVGERGRGKGGRDIRVGA